MFLSISDHMHEEGWCCPGEGDTTCQAGSHPLTPLLHTTQPSGQPEFFFFFNQAGGWLVVKLGLDSRLLKPRALLCTLLLLLFITFQRPCQSPLSPPLQAQLRPAWPSPLKSPARGSLVSGVAARRCLCSLTGPIHWPWLRPRETRGHCSVSEVAAVLTTSSGARGGRERPPEEQNRGSLQGFSVLSPQPCPVWAPSKAASPGGRFGSFPSRALPVLRGASRPSSLLSELPLLWAYGHLALSPGAVAVHLGLSPVPFPPTRREGGTRPLHLDLAQSCWPFRHRPLLGA